MHNQYRILTYQVLHGGIRPTLFRRMINKLWMRFPIYTKLRTMNNRWPSVGVRSPARLWRSLSLMDSHKRGVSKNKCLWCDSVTARFRDFPYFYFLNKDAIGYVLHSSYLLIALMQNKDELIRYVYAHPPEKAHFLNIWVLEQWTPIESFKLNAVYLFK